VSARRWRRSRSRLRAGGERRPARRRPGPAWLLPADADGAAWQPSGSFEAAHALRDGTAAPAPLETGEVYDLIVVGGGISGLSAALLYRDHVPAARVLVLDNTTTSAVTPSATSSGSTGGCS